MIAVGVNLSPVPPAELAEAARRAEELGYESGWVGEHVVIPWGFTTQYPYADHPPLRPDFRFYDPLAALSHAAAATTTLRLGTGVLVLPLRDPYVTSRAIATTDALSGGRLLLGMGAGWLREEFDVVGRSFADRGGRFDEAIELLSSLFADDRPEFHGRHFQLPPTSFEPKPFQRPRPPFLLGGATPAALRRAARFGDGWYGSRHRPVEAAALVERLRLLVGERPLSFTCGAVAGTTLDEYEAAGLDRVVVTPWPRVSQWRSGLEAAAVALGLDGASGATGRIDVSAL